jgi:hypothetical protein
VSWTNLHITIFRACLAYGCTVKPRFYTFKGPSEVNTKMRKAEKSGKYECYNIKKAGVTMNDLRLYFTGSNDAILNDISQTTAVSGGGASLTRRCQDTAFEYFLVVPLGNVSLRVWISMTCWSWRLSFHKGQWHLTTGASHTAAL